MMVMVMFVEEEDDDDTDDYGSWLVLCSNDMMISYRSPSDASEEPIEDESWSPR